MKSTIKFNKNETYVVACSFGPDSMAAINFMYEQNLHVVAAHVNYHKRDVSDKEQYDLENWCKERKIPCEVLDTNGLEHKGNFQSWARKIRYDFFESVAKKYNTKNVVVAHQKDDLIETYLMQKKRGNCTKNAGIAEKIEQNGIIILRPFLCNTKNELIQYDKENNVPFSIDVSNLSDLYERNKIRHSVIEKMNEKDKEELYQKIVKENEAKKETIVKDFYTKDDIENMSSSEFQNILINFLEKCGVYRPISSRFSGETLKALKSEKSNVKILLTDNYFVVKEYEKIRLVKIDNSTYKYILKNKDDKLVSDFLEIDFSMGASDRNIAEEDYPLTIKPVDSNDEYTINSYKVCVRRLLIDWKVPVRIRSIWPGIYNKNNKLVYLPRYRETYTDNHQSKMLIKIK